MAHKRRRKEIEGGHRYKLRIRDFLRTWQLGMTESSPTASGQENWASGAREEREK